MNPNPVPAKMSPEEFLIWERSEEFRHEYRDGEIVAMSGARRTHNLISVNMASELRAALKARDCETYASEMRVWIPKTRLYTYPDIDPDPEVAKRVFAAMMKMKKIDIAEIEAARRG